MNRIKVAHIITKLELGGAQQNTLYTCEHLDRERFDVLLIAGKGGMLDSEALSSGFRTYFLKDLVRPIHPWLDMRALWRLVQVLRMERPRIVHTHSSKAGVLGRLAAFLAGVPVRIHTYHGFGFHDRQNPLLRFILLSAEEAAAAVSDCLVFVSRANRETARRIGLGNVESYRLIRSGIQLQGLPGSVEPDRKLAELGKGLRKPLVLSIGNLKPQKRPDDFVRLSKMVYERHPEARFLFIGDGELRLQVEELLRAEGLEGICFFPGWRRDVSEIIAVSDVFVLTSLWEGLPRALVEAMRSGLPPVCYSTDGVADLVQDGVNGYSAEPGRLDVLADRVSELIEHEELRKRLGRAAAASVGPEFDIDAMVKRQEELYLSLLELGS